jgi:uncharacterized protein (TIGR00255 family)
VGSAHPTPWATWFVIAGRGLFEEVVVLPEIRTNLLLLSMTGFGEARTETERLSVAVEVRTVNNRFLKVSSRLGDVYAGLEGQVERVVRERIGRGTVTVSVRVDRHSRPEDFRVNTIAIQAYLDQLTRLRPKTAGGESDPIGPLTSLLLAPGVVEDTRREGVDVEADWQIIQPVLEEALKKLHVFRVEEGQAMERDLRTNAQVVTAGLAKVTEMAPQVSSDFRTKLIERINLVLKDQGVQLQPADVIREVAVYADRTDINEELTRLKSHLDQFEAFLVEQSSTGRKLDFLVQELNREVNTIGSKANHVGIAHCVVEMKAAIERIRELLQNVE